MRRFPPTLPALPTLPLVALLAACSSCKDTSAPAGPPPVALTLPEPASLAPESPRPILSRAAAFVPADAQVVVVFRTWREAVESLALRAALDNPVGRDLLNAWKIGGATLTDLTGLAALGMDVDQSLVLAVLPDEAIMVVVASETPAKLLGLFREAAGGAEGEAVTVEGREARVFSLGEARFTVVLHARHVQIVISNPASPAGNVDNQLQAAFDSAPVWMRRAQALPTPQGATAVMWTAGDPPAPPTPAAPADAPEPPRSFAEVVQSFEAAYLSEEEVLALSFPGGDLRLDVVSRVRDVEVARARLRTGASPAQALALLPAGAIFASLATVSGKDAEVVSQAVSLLPANVGGLDAAQLAPIFGAGVAPKMFAADPQVRTLALARYPDAGETATVLVLETGAVDRPGETLPAMLKAIATGFGKADAAVTAEKCGDRACWRLALARPMLCAPADPWLVCGLGEGPFRQSLALLAAGAPPRPTGDDVLSLAYADVPALAGTLSEMAGKAGAPVALADALKMIGDDIAALTYSERLGPENATITLNLKGRGRPILGALVPRLAQAAAPLLPLLE
jgi:hypothetical protein